MKPTPTLDVFFGDERVGAIHDSTPLSFTYSAAWLARPERAQIAAIAPAAAAAGHLAFHPHPQAQHQAARQNVALGGQ